MGSCEEPLAAQAEHAEPRCDNAVVVPVLLKVKAGVVLEAVVPAVRFFPVTNVVHLAKTRVSLTVTTLHCNGHLYHWLCGQLQHHEVHTCGMKCLGGLLFIVSSLDNDSV
jgi:hypothetical protein